MSCITGIGSQDDWHSDEKLNYSAPKWTDSKRKRLAQMAYADDPRLRAIAAAHPKTPALTLIELMHDPDVQVRRAAIKNPNATAHMVEWALADEDLGIAAYARMLEES